MKYLKYIILVLISFLMITKVHAANNINIYMFYGKTCPHCEAELEYFNSIKNDYNFTLTKYEVWYNQSNQSLMKVIANKYGVTVTGVPFTIICNQVITGYGENTPNLIENAIKSCNNKPSIADQIIKGEEIEGVDGEQLIADSIDIPLLGNVSLKSLSLPVISMVIGAVDGFNPCAMWVLLFLITMLIGMKNRKRMWTLGIVFLITSASIYFLFLLAWFNVINLLGSIQWFQLLIAVVALIGGIININSYIKSLKEADGCTVVDEKKRKITFKWIKKIINEKSFFIAIIGVMLLAVAVNVFELACSAGLPVIFTQILAVNQVSNMAYIGYLLIYIFFFLFDDILIFIIAMISLKVTGLSTKYSRWSHLIGGILMLLVGILLIVKPEWLMFNF